MRIFSLIHERGRAFSAVGVILITLLWPGTLVQAGPVAINEVIQIISNHQNAPELRLRALTQIGSTANKQATNAKPAATDSLFPGADFQTDQKPTNVVVINQGDVAGTICDCGENQGDVAGTICDCGEIMVAGGGFPKWPLLFLAAIPLFFIDRDTPPFTAGPVPTPPAPLATPSIPSNPPIPEPASMILFGSGLLALGAGFRRRKAKIKAAAPAEGT